MKSFVLRNIALAATVISFGAFAQGSGSATQGSPSGQQPGSVDQPKHDQMHQQGSTYDQPSSTTTTTDTMKTDKQQSGSASLAKPIAIEQAKFLIILPAGQEQQQVFSDLAGQKGAVEKFAWSCEGAAGGAMGGSASSSGSSMSGSASAQKDVQKDQKDLQKDVKDVQKDQKDLQKDQQAQKDLSKDQPKDQRRGELQNNDMQQDKDIVGNSDTSGKGSTTTTTTTTNTQRQGRSGSMSGSAGAASSVVVSECTGYMLINADSEQSALQQLPANVRGKAKVQKLHKFNQEEQKSFRNKQSAR